MATQWKMCIRDRTRRTYPVHYNIYISLIYEDPMYCIRKDSKCIPETSNHSNTNKTTLDQIWSIFLYICIVGSQFLYNMRHSSTETFSPGRTTVWQTSHKRAEYWFLLVASSLQNIWDLKKGKNFKIKRSPLWLITFEIKALGPLQNMLDDQ